MTTKQRIFAIVPLLIIAASSAHSQSNSPGDVWRRIVNANQPWLQPNDSSLTYEIEGGSTSVGDRNTLQVIYDGANGDARIQGQIYSSEFQWIYTGGVKADLELGQYEFNQSLPASYGVGVAIQPAVMQAAQQGGVPESLQIVGRQSVDGRNVIVLEAPEWNQKGSVGIDPGVSGSSTQFDYKGVRWTVDADNYTLIREEALAGADANAKRTWDFSEGYYQTADGYAPKSITWSETYAKNPEASRKMEFSYQMVYGDAWFVKEAKSYQNGNLNYMGEVKKVSAGPVDKSKFDLAAAGIHISEVTQGTAVVEGRVLLRGSKKPVEGATVKLVSSYKTTRNPVWGETVTKQDGSFRFTSLPALTYYAVAQKEGLMGTLEDQRILYMLMSENIPFDGIRQSFAKAEPPDGETVSVDVELSEPKTVRGIVLDSDTGEPIPEATVGVRKTTVVQKEGRESETGQTDANGRFEFDGLPAQQVIFGAKKEGYFGRDWTPESLHYSPYSEDKIENIKSVDLSKSDAPEEIILKLQQGGTIAGTVEDETGDPIEGANVWLDYAKPFRSKEDGSFEFTGLARTQTEQRKEGYQLIANASGYAPFKQKDIHVLSTKPVRIDVVLKQGARITGAIRNPGGEALSGVKVTVSLQPQFKQTDSKKFDPIARAQNAAMGMYGMGMGMMGGMGGMGMMAGLGMEDAYRDKTGAEGKYNLHSLSEGTYWIKAATDGYEPFVGMNVQVENGKETQFDIHMTPMEPVSGIVVSATGQPLPGVDINLQEESNPKRDAAGDDPLAIFQIEAARTHPHATSDENGRFVITNLYDAVFKLNASYATKGKEQQTKEISGVRPGQSDIEVRFDDPRERPDLNVKVVDAAAGLPVERFKIQFHNTFGVNISSRDRHLQILQYVGRDVVSASGEYFIKDMPMQPAELVVSAPGYAAQLIGPVDPDREVNQAFVPLAKEGRIHARLKDAKPLNDITQVSVTPHVSANLTRLSPFHAGAYYTFGTQSTVNNDEIRVYNIPTGLYDLTAVSENGVASATCVQVTPGETTEVDNFSMMALDNSQEITEYRFRIQRKDGSPQPLTPVKIHLTADPSQRSDERTTDAKGRFDLKLPLLPEFWRKVVLQVGDSPGVLYETTLQPGDNVITHDPPQGNSTVRGVVLKDGEPVGKLTATLVSLDGGEESLVYQQETNGMGRYVMNGVPAGRYYLMLASKTYPVSEREFRLYEIDLAESENQFVRADITGPSLSGMVTNENNEPIGGAYVRLSLPWEPNARVASVIMFGPQRCTQTDAHGVFKFENLQAGEYALWSSRYSHGISEKQTAKVDEQNIDNLRLILK